MKRFYVDVREPDEYANGHVDGAINVPTSSLGAAVASLRNLPKEVELIVYCRSGGRAEACLPVFRQLGFANVVNGINQQHVEAVYSGEE